MKNKKQNIEEIIQDALDFTIENINWKISEHDLLEFIHGKLGEQKIIFTEETSVSFAENNKIKNYKPKPDSSKIIRKKSILNISISYIDNNSKNSLLSKEIKLEELYYKKKN
ncbi:MAG: hypothetical protein GWO78_01255 [Dehalococcoidales bacterium]|nr:hypothetical protein [Dehalococcoidales bacterium]